MSLSRHFDVIVLGGGPAGLTAAIYMSRAKARVMVLDQAMFGGQMILTHEIANYPGYSSISGFQLAQKMQEQAALFGVVLKGNIRIVEVDFESEMKKVVLDTGESFTSDGIIIATGGRSKTIGARGEELFKGRGISYCATCDGDFFTGKEIIVVGGGNTALEEAVALTKYASKITLVHQFDYFQAFQQAVEEAEAHPSIRFLLNARVVEFYGEQSLKGALIENVKTAEITDLKTDGAFIFIGYEANTDFLHGKCIQLNNWQEIVVDEHMKTNIDGVYAAGDALAKKIRQITTAVSDGTLAALNLMTYLNEKKKRVLV